MLKRKSEVSEEHTEKRKGVIVAEPTPPAQISANQLAKEAGEDHLLPSEEQDNKLYSPDQPTPTKSDKPRPKHAFLHPKVDFEKTINDKFLKEFYDYDKIEEEMRQEREAPGNKPRQPQDPRAKPTRTPPKDHYRGPSRWKDISPSTDQRVYSQGVDSMDFSMSNWTYRWAENQPEVIEERMTAKDKQAIIDYLGDWSLFKDWESLVATFSAPAHDERFFILLAATIYKTVFEKVVKNPFFYVDLEEDWDGSNAELPTPYGVQLNKHLEKALKVSEVDANRWRASTVRLFNRCNEYVELAQESAIMAKDTNPGLRSYNLRQKYIDQLVTDLLDGPSIITPLLSWKELDEHESECRYRDLRCHFNWASQMAVHCYLQEAAFRFDEKVEDVCPYKVPITAIHSNDFKWMASVFSHDSPLKDALDGQKAVLIMWPATWMTQWKYAEREYWENNYKEYSERYGIRPDRGYFDEKGDHHFVLASGIVILEKLEDEDERSPEGPMGGLKN